MAAYSLKDPLRHVIHECRFTSPELGQNLEAILHSG